MSTTPRTDSNTIAGTVILHNGQCTAQMVSSSFARQLENELTAMTARAEKAEADFATERAIVSRIWVQLGSPTYAELKGRSIYDLIDEMKARAEKAEAELARAHDIIKRASVQFFHDGTDGDAAAKMLTVLNEAAMKEASK